MVPSSLAETFEWIGTGGSQQLTRALLHFLWQGCLIAVLYAIAARAMRRGPANARYGTGVAALLLMAACLPATLWMLPRPAMPPATTEIDEPGSAAPTQAITPMPEPAAVEAERMPGGQPVSVPATKGTVPVFVAGSRQNGTVPLWPAFLAWLLTCVSPYASGLYLCGVAVMLLRVSVGLQGGRGLRRCCTPLTGGAIFAMVREHARRLRLRVIPMVACAERVSVPIVVGVVRPMILLPASLASGLTLQQTEAVLLHELAHIRRLDPLVNVLQRLVEAMLFFHPAVWWLSQRIAAERENACDDLVLRSNCSRTAYADALVRMAELSLAPQRCRGSEAAALGATGSHSSQFKRRVLRLLGAEESPRLRLSALGTLGLAAAIGVAVLLPLAWHGAVRAEAQPSLAQGDHRDVPSQPADREPAKPPSKKAAGRPISMSAAEFARLSPAEQRALLVRVFQQRLEHAENLYYELEQVSESYEDANRGATAKHHGSRVRVRHWQLGNSSRLDNDVFYSLEATEPSYRSYAAVNAEECVSRNISVCKGKQAITQGQVAYPYDSGGMNLYTMWLPSPHFSEPARHLPEALFPYLIMHQNQFEITVLAQSDRVQLTIPWQPQGATMPRTKRICLLDPEKGFLPVQIVTRDEAIPGDLKSILRTETLTVDESRLVDGVWMPIKMSQTGLIPFANPTAPTCTSFDTVSVLQMVHGKVRLADLFEPFPAGTQVADVIEGATYVADTMGNPSKVEFSRGWWQKPPEGWTWHQPLHGATSWRSQFAPADREKLAAAKRVIAQREERMAKLLKSTPRNPAINQQALIDNAIEVLRIYQIADHQRLWASAIRELIQIGKPAVPKLIAELDRTQRNTTLRALGFVLRGIGDPRAIPAMIRTIPRLSQPAGSDFGLPINDDPPLAHFMREHGEDYQGGRGGPPEGAVYFSFGRPIREIMPALEKMTGQRLGWEELNFAHLEGDLNQQRAARRQFLQLARRWADWWSQHWREYVDKESDAQLDLIQQTLKQCDATLAAGSQPSRSAFPRGAHVTESRETMDQFTRSFREWPSNGFLDLDTGRHPKPPADLLRQSPEDKPSTALWAWAEREGVDLINIKVTPSGSDKSFYAFQPVGMKVWRVANDRYDTIVKELRAEGKFQLPQPWEGPLAQLDEKTGAYDDKLTATFLFITKEGTCGAIQLRAPLSQKLVPGLPTGNQGGLRYKFIYEEAWERTAPNRSKKG